MTTSRGTGQKLWVGIVSLAGWLGFRERYILTKHRLPRMRYLIMPVVLMLTAYGADTIAEARLLSQGHKSANLQYEGLTGQLAITTAAYSKLPKKVPSSTQQSAKNSKNNRTATSNPEKEQRTSLAHMTDEGVVIPPASKPTPDAITRQRTIGKGDTMAGILASAGMTKEHYNPRTLKPGQNVSIKLKPRNKAMDIAGFRVNIDPARMIRVARNGEGDFRARFEKKKTHRELSAKEIVISGSLYGSAARNDIPASIISKAINVFSWDVDFQRDLHRGDSLKILYASDVTDDGVYTGKSTVVYASLDMRGHKIATYRYQKQNGDVGYFKPNGHSVRKALMTTPVDGGRISSGYGKRKHPILGYSKMHEGVDFAAPTGTPVYAAGNGVIERASRYGSYGNYIRMRHNAHLKTAYAHLNRYAEGLRPGQRVEQGDIIGYIGSTGRSTGPHLHYEVIDQGEPVNPQNLDMPTGEILQGEALKRFKNRVDEIKTAYRTHTGEMKYAAHNRH